MRFFFSLGSLSVVVRHSELTNITCFYLQLDHQISQLDAIPKIDAASKRTALSKLQKDFERIKINIQAIQSESSLIKVSMDLAGTENFNRIGDASSAASKPSRADLRPAGGIAGSTDDDNLPLPPTLKLMPLMQGQEVDDAIMEERERDIRKINQDLAMVNEMFK
jgi:hypothetical protein